MDLVLDWFEGDFLSRRDLEQFLLFAMEAPGAVRAVPAGDYVLLYHDGQERGMGLVAATWLFYNGVEGLERLAGGRGVGCGGEDYEEDEWVACLPRARGLSVARLYGMVGVAGVDRETGRVFFHLAPPELAALLHLVPPDRLGDEDLVRALMGFDLNPWEGGGGLAEVRLRVQGDLVASIYRVRGVEHFLSLLAALETAPARALAALGEAVGEVAGLPPGLPEARLPRVVAGLVEGVLAGAAPACIVEGRVDVVDAHAWGRGTARLAWARVRLEPRQSCSLNDLLGARSAALAGVFHNLSPTVVMERGRARSAWGVLWLALWPEDPGDLAAAAYRLAELMLREAAGGAGGYAAVARGRYGTAVLVYEGVVEYVSAAVAAAALDALARLAAGDGGPVVEALGPEALAGPLTVTVGRHLVTLREASLLRLPRVLAEQARLAEAQQGAEQAMEAYRALMAGGGNERTLLQRAWANPDLAKQLFLGLARVYHAYPLPAEAILVPTNQVVEARHPEHGEAQVAVEGPALITLRFIPRARMELEEPEEDVVVSPPPIIVGPAPTPHGEAPGGGPSAAEGEEEEGEAGGPRPEELLTPEDESILDNLSAFLGSASLGEWEPRGEEGGGDGRAG